MLNAHLHSRAASPSRASVTACSRLAVGCYVHRQGKPCEPQGHLAPQGCGPEPTALLLGSAFLQDNLHGCLSHLSSAPPAGQMNPC